MVRPKPIQDLERRCGPKVPSFHGHCADVPSDSAEQRRVLGGGGRRGDSVRYALGKREPLLVEHEAFRDAILGTGSDIVNMRDGQETVRVAEAVIESASTGRTVALEAL